MTRDEPTTAAATTTKGSDMKQRAPTKTSNRWLIRNLSMHIHILAHSARNVMFDVVVVIVVTHPPRKSVRLFNSWCALREWVFHSEHIMISFQWGGLDNSFPAIISWLMLTIFLLNLNSVNVAGLSHVTAYRARKIMRDHDLSHINKPIIVSFFQTPATLCCWWSFTNSVNFSYDWHGMQCSGNVTRIDELKFGLQQLLYSLCGSQRMDIQIYRGVRTSDTHIAHTHLKSFRVIIWVRISFSALQFISVKFIYYLPFFHWEMFRRREQVFPAIFLLQTQRSWKNFLFTNIEN